uniref:Uncharacterized protein n=1 Tax=Anguilla anguilla TaxID=7936 RepID=A0A0E9QCL0_ANGAN
MSKPTNVKINREPLSDVKC